MNRFNKAVKIADAARKGAETGFTIGSGIAGRKGGIAGAIIGGAIAAMAAAVA